MTDLLEIPEAAERLRKGAVLAWPTEAIYGLGCDPWNESAVRRILELKQRPQSMGLILIASDFRQLDGLLESVPAAALEPVLASWPGPFTWLFPRTSAVPEWISGTHATLAVRVTAHPLSRELCSAFGGPLVSTSANPHGAAPAIDAAQVQAFFGARIDGIVAGELGDRERCSEIRDVLSGKVLRAG